MTENEYIKVKDLGHIISAKDCLRHIMPETSEYITRDEYENVMKIISLWETKHLVNIKLSNDFVKKKYYCKACDITVDKPCEGNPHCQAIIACGSKSYINGQFPPTKEEIKEAKTFIDKWTSDNKDQPSVPKTIVLELLDKLENSFWKTKEELEKQKWIDESAKNRKKFWWR